MLLLAGCSSVPAAVNPVDWWHSLEGGQIAEQRPPPPKPDAPYPNLGSVPARPVPTDPAARARIASSLIADRANARYTGAISPDPGSPRTAPQAFGRGTAPPPPPPADTAGATLAAATAPQRPLGPPQPPLPAGPATPPRPAPQGKVQSAPLSPPVSPAASPQPSNLMAATPMPTSPPPAPRIPGVAVPTVTVPTPPPVAPSPPPAAPQVTADAVLVPFAPASTEIASASQNALRDFARRHPDAGIDAIGYGDAEGADPAAQAAALPLAMARARAIAAVLEASGVAAARVHLDAAAEGKGGAARIGK